MDLTADSFRALARSSPWRWRRLHFRHRSDYVEDSVEAWIVRPGRLWTRTRDGGLRAERFPQADADELVPTWRPDGLVDVRPDDWAHHLDDPLWGPYTWVAMLDPQELSHHVAVGDLGVTERHGRETWWATVRAEEGYEARCAGCCDLLLGGAAAGVEHVVGLDAQTGVLVSLTAPEVRHRAWFLDTRILAVDDGVAPPS